MPGQIRAAAPTFCACIGLSRKVNPLFGPMAQPANSTKGEVRDESSPFCFVPAGKFAMETPLRASEAMVGAVGSRAWWNW